MSSPLEQFHQTTERHTEGTHGPRWVPVAAAVLAVLAAVSGAVANLRATNALVAKNDAIVATAKAADTWNEYEARSIKQHIYEAAQVTAPAKEVPRLHQVAEHERTAAKPVMAKAKDFEHQADLDNERSERLLGAHEVLEVSTTLFEVAIVLVSIVALVGSRLLPIVAAIASGAGLAILVFGVFL